ncbi:lysozyme domain protein, partial [Yersinia pestis PY-34]
MVEQHRALIARRLLQRLHLFAAVLNAEQLPGVVQITTRVVVQAEQL